MSCTYCGSESSIGSTRADSWYYSWIWR